MSLYLNRKCGLLFAQNGISIRETCDQNIKSVVVMNGVCEPMLAAILKQAFFASELLASKAPGVVSPK